MGTWKTQRRSKKIGGDQDDFEVEIVPVRIHRTRREAIWQEAKMVIVPIVAITIAQVFIIPWLVG